MNKKLVLLAATLTAGFLMTPSARLNAADHAPAHANQWAAVKTAVAVLAPTAGSKTRGEIRFSQDGDAVKITGQVEGLEPNQKHAIHIHQFGDCTAPDGASAGGHYNPENHPHALPEKDMRHAGDLGNLQADAQGKARLELTVKNISIAGTMNPIVGRAVIVHAKPDDGGQPVGNAGARIACGVIGVGNTPK